jgi:hypothetical protein
MANTNAPFGLRLLQRQNDATPSFGLGMDPLKIAAANTNKIAKGDGLARLATGYVDRIGAAGTAASQWVGVFWGCSYLSTSQGKRVVSPYWPGGDTTTDVDVIYIPLMGVPNARFVIQATSTAIAFADIGQNYDIAYAAPTVFGSWARSNTTLATTGATTATLPFRLVGLWSQYQRQSGQPGTDNTTSFNWGVVEFNGNQETGI